MVSLFNRLTKHEKYTILIAIFGIGFFVFFINFQEVLSIYYDPRNHLSFHILLEFMSIFVSFMIFYYGLLLYRKSNSQMALLFSVVFLAVGIFDIFHTVTFKGMPFFLTESSVAKATWFWIMGRMTEAVSMLIIIAVRFQHLRTVNLKTIIVGMLSYILIISITILFFATELPLLVEEGVGTTTLKNSLEYIISLIHFIAIGILIFHYNKAKQPSDLYMILAFILLIIGEIVFTTYQSVHDLNNFLGHFYKVCGYAFIFRGVLIPLMNEPFINKEFAEGETKNIKKQLDLILGHMPDAVSIVNQSYEIVYVNDGFANLFGWKKEDVINKNIVNIGFQQDKLEKVKSMEMLIQSFEGQQFQNYESSIKTTNGESIIVSATFFPIKNHFDEITSVTIIMRDITEKKEAEKALIKSEKLSVVGELAAGVAHEIRNPLTTIKGFMKLLEDHANENEKKYIHLMLDEVDRINLITSEFMTIAKPQVKQFKQENLNRILDEIIQFSQPNLLMNNITLHQLNKCPLPPVNCEEYQLKQVFINVLKNAMEAMPTGGKITIATAYDQKNVKVQIKDEGCGIPEEIIERLGEPFYTLKEKGTGLGLMVCFRIIEQHNGRILISSKVGKGTTIEIVLPIDAKEPRTEVVS